MWFGIREDEALHPVYSNFSMTFQAKCLFAERLVGKRSVTSDSGGAHESCQAESGKNRTAAGAASFFEPFCSLNSFISVLNS